MKTKKQKPSKSKYFFVTKVYELQNNNKYALVAEGIGNCNLISELKFKTLKARSK